MTLTESSIYISIKRLRTLLFQAQFDMPKGYRIVNRGKQKAKRMNRNIRASDVLKLLPSINSYLGFCKNTNGYNQAKSIIRKLSPKWGEFVRFNKHRVCIEALPDYTERNQIIKRYNLLRNGTNRKRRA